MQIQTAMRYQYILTRIDAIKNAALNFQKNTEDLELPTQVLIKVSIFTL